VATAALSDTQNGPMLETPPAGRVTLGTLGASVCSRASAHPPRKRCGRRGETQGLGVVPDRAAAQVDQSLVAQCDTRLARGAALSLEGGSGT
jgi:hypothetical protein